MTVHQLFSHSRREQKQQRLEGQKAHKADREAKLDRTRHNRVHDDIELENILRQFGLSIINIPPALGSREAVFAEVPHLMDGRRPEYLDKKALNFLIDEFNAEVIDDGKGHAVLNFPRGEAQGDDMASFFARVAKKSGQKQSLVKEVYEAMLVICRVSLRDDRYVRLPDLVRIRVAYRPAKERRKGINPFTGKKQWFEAKEAKNTVKVSPLKRLKDYVAAKVEVVDTRKKKKVKK